MPDIVAIHNSKDARDGRPIKGKFYHQSVEGIGGAPTAPIASRRPNARNTTSRTGACLVEGYRQGGVQTEEMLVGYISSHALAADLVGTAGSWATASI